MFSKARCLHLLNHYFWLSAERVASMQNMATVFKQTISCMFVMHPPLGIECIVLWFVRPSNMRPSFRPSNWTMPRWPTNQLTFVHPYVRPSVHPSREVSMHLPRNAWMDWPGIGHADISRPPSELIRLWSRWFSYFWHHFDLSELNCQIWVFWVFA